MTDDRRLNLVSFSSDEDGTIHLRDEVESTSLELTAPDDVRLQSALPALFYVPVDAAVSFETDELAIGPNSNVLLRDERGNPVGEFLEETTHVPSGTYYLDITADVKAYVRIEDTAFAAGYDGKPSMNDLVVSFDDPTTLTVGVRSMYTKPATEITVPDDPGALAEALSYAGCGLKELSPERSWPTLRGHPPAFRRGDELDVPSALSKPESGVTVTVPENYADVYRVAPLAHYLGATIETGDDAAVVLDNGYRHDLRDRYRSLDSGVEGVLARALLLDTITRYGGYYSLPRYEYDQVAPHLPFYPEKLYDSSISELLMEYLEVEDEVVKEFGLTWPMIGVVPPSADALPVLSSLLNALVPIQVRSSRPDEDELLFDAMSVAYSTEDAPVGSDRLTARAFENGWNRPPPNGATIAVVTEDRTTAETIRDNAESNDWLRLGQSLTVTTSLPDEEVDCLVLDLPAYHPVRRASLDSLSFTPRTLVVRADDGLVDGFIEDGTVAGIVLHDNPTSTELTRLLAALDIGLPLSAAVDVLPLSSSLVGDPRSPAALQENGAPASQIELTPLEQGGYAADFRIFGTGYNSLGGVGRSDLDPFPDTYHLANCTARLDNPLDTADVLTILNDEYVFCELDGELVLGTHPVTESDLDGTTAHHFAADIENPNN